MNIGVHMFLSNISSCKGENTICFLYWPLDLVILSLPPQSLLSITVSLIWCLTHPSCGEGGIEMSMETQICFPWHFLLPECSDIKSMFLELVLINTVQTAFIVIITCKIHNSKRVMLHWQVDRKPTGSFFLLFLHLMQLSVQAEYQWKHGSRRKRLSYESQVTMKEKQ